MSATSLAAGTRDQELRQRVLDRSHSTEDGCWHWTGFKNHQGYGKIQTEHGQLAHRLAYVLWRGPIPDAERTRTADRIHSACTRTSSEATA